MFTIKQEVNTSYKYQPQNYENSLAGSHETINIVQGVSDPPSQRYAQKHTSEDEFSVCEIPDEGRKLN